MSNPPRIWLDYRPVRIGWVISNQDIAQLVTSASWNACLWGGRYNCIIPSHDTSLADALVACFAVDILLPVRADEHTKAFIDRFPHLHHHRWRDGIFHEQRCEFADIRHVWRRIFALQGKDIDARFAVASWEEGDALAPMFALVIGRYPSANESIPNYRNSIERTFKVSKIEIEPAAEVPASLLEKTGPMGLTSYDLGGYRAHDGWLAPGIVLGSVTDFDALVLHWNLRAAGARAIFYDVSHGSRLKAFADAFLKTLHDSTLDKEPRVNFWMRGERPRDDSWKPDLEVGGLQVALCDGRGSILWNGMNIKPSDRNFSVRYRDVVPSYTESDRSRIASFALPDRPFSDDDYQASEQKFVVVVDASQYGEPDAELTFETPVVPRLNEFYGRNFHHDYDAARSQQGRVGKGAVAIIIGVSRQRLEVNAFQVFDWMKAFFALCGMEISRSEAGLRCSRVITQMGGVQGCRVFKIRGVRTLLGKYGIDEHFTRSGAIEAIRDVDPGTDTVGFDAFEHLFIEYREKEDLKPDDVLRYLLKRRVFRVGLEFTCPNCRLPSWVHLDDIKTQSHCSYCDHLYDVSAQLKDRDWRYRRSGIFGRDDHQLGAVPVALTLQQLDTSLHRNFLMYSTAMNFRPAGSAIEACESDFVGIVGGGGSAEAPVQIVFGETKTEGSIDDNDIRRLGKLADAVPRDLARAYILLSKTSTFSTVEIALAKTLNVDYRRRVILWSRDELEPYFLYEGAKDRLGADWHAVSLRDMADITHRLYFS